MCFYIHPDYPDAMIADKDIPVKKVLHEIMRVIPNGKYTIINGTGIMQSPIYREIYFNKNYHLSCTKHEKIMVYLDIIEQGLHSFSVEKGLKDSLNIYDGIIPYGTKYYFNPDSLEYASEKLIVFNH